jgi:hypothetical protein
VVLEKKLVLTVWYGDNESTGVGRRARPLFKFILKNLYYIIRNGRKLFNSRLLPYVLTQKINASRQVTADPHLSWTLNFPLEFLT